MPSSEQTPSSQPVPFDADSPWGKYAASGWQALLIKCCHALPTGSQLAYSINKGLRGPVKSGTPRYLDADVLGLRLRLLSRGNYCETTALFAPQFYDQIEMNWLRQALTDESVFVDVGGNVGLYSLIAAKHNPSAQVITIEPETSLLERMRFNAETNNLKVHAANTALSDYEGTGILDTDRRQSGQNQLVGTDTPSVNDTADSRTNEGANETGKREVSVTTLPQLCQSLGVKHIDIMKIDIEGHEHRVLQHFIENAPSELFPTRIIIEHVHDINGTVDMLEKKADYRVMETSKRNVLLQRV